MVKTLPLTLLRRHWPPLAGLACAAALAIAHASQRWGGLAPCHLCLQQREVYWGALAFAAGATGVLALWPRPLLYRGLTLLLGVAFLGAAGLAAYHVAVEQKWVAVPETCAATTGPIDFTTDLLTQLEKPMALPRCDAIPWQFLGVSMAGYNVLFALALAGLSFAASVVGGAPPRSPAHD